MTTERSEIMVLLAGDPALLEAQRQHCAELAAAHEALMRSYRKMALALARYKVRQEASAGGLRLLD